MHLLTQAANDLNLTLVVDETHAPRLVQRLHRLLIRPTESDPVLGPTWEQLTAGQGTPPRAYTPWWIERREELVQLCPEDAAVFEEELTAFEDRLMHRSRGGDG